ncbi:serine/threonine protein kinase [Actinoplanes sp. NPDC051494]|uniref:serine/threonine protein kinase n=1 Tax=Actinoplanes sp. NPDC051494 TaxID=3363907 RepID=UPI003794209E
MKAPLRPSDPRVIGGYRLTARLGQGGMGTVYLGHGPDGRAVAIKVVKPELAYEDEFRARFRSEVNRARQVPPFCTAELLDADFDHEMPYLVTEFVDGPSLHEIVAGQGPLGGGSLHSVAIGVATALAAIHGAGVIHRDLKPDNVLFALGNPKVIDFGIARAFEATSRHTGTDQMVGTVAYMAPERFDADSSRIGPAADVFAWGVVVTYAGTGRTPFGGDSAAATAGAILTRPPRLDGLPQPLRDLVERTLAKEPERRPTAFELLEELVAVGAATTVAGTGRPELRQAARAALRTEPDHSGNRQTGIVSRRWRRLAPLLSLLGVLAVASALFAFTPARDLVLGKETASAPGPSSTDDSGDDDAGPVEAPAVSRPPAAPECRDTDVTIVVTAQSENPAALGTQKGLVTIENTSSAACRVDGRVHLSVYDPTDSRIDVATSFVDEPGEAVEILLRPGTGAFQGIKWQACDRDECAAGNTMRGSLEPSGRGEVVTLEGFPDPNRPDIAMSSLQLGTIQPSRQGVVAW